tara:strand:+ start:123 stop:377 length:255 start_codon:yes stop_codon:yes gene_type:complete
MKLKPLNKNIIVERVEAETKTAGGLIIPNAIQKHEGFIIAIGSKVEDVKVGDKALFSKWSEKEIKFDNKTYLVMHETDVFCLLN